MQNSSRQDPSRSLVAAWLLVAVALCVVVGAWGTTIGGLLNSSDSTNRANTTRSFSTLDGGVFTPGATFTMVPTSGCLVVDSGDGSQVVMSAATGSLLTEAQAENCTK